MGCGCAAQGDPKELVTELGTLRPTFMIGAPRVYDRLHLLTMSMVCTCSPRAGSQACRPGAGSLWPRPTRALGPGTSQLADRACTYRSGERGASRPGCSSAALTPSCAASTAGSPAHGCAPCTPLMSARTQPGLSLSLQPGMTGRLLVTSCRCCTAQSWLTCCVRAGQQAVGPARLQEGGQAPGRPPALCHLWQRPPVAPCESRCSAQQPCLSPAPSACRPGWRGVRTRPCAA